MALTFHKEKFSGLDGRTYVRFVQVCSQSENTFTILASASGISFFGKMLGEIGDQKDLESFADAVGSAMKASVALRPKLTHDIPPGVLQ